MQNTKIEYCDNTWNPVTGCRHGCDYCYARQIARRFGGFSEPQEGALVDSKGNFELDTDERKFRYDSNGKRVVAPYPFGFTPTLHRYRFTQPRKWHNPKTIFVCSMADLFGNWVPDSWITDVMKAANEATQHRYLFLTKNPDRYGALLAKGILPQGEAARNKWYGCSITKPDDVFYWVDEEAEGIDYNGFLSIEPILADFPSHRPPLPKCVKWIIIGAETGNRKEKVTPKKEWVDHICEVASKTGIPVFMKDSLISVMGEENMRREFPWRNGDEG